MKLPKFEMLMATEIDQDLLDVQKQLKKIASKILKSENKDELKVNREYIDGALNAVREARVQIDCAMHPPEDGIKVYMVN